MRGELGEYSSGLKAHVRLWVNTAAMTEYLPTALATFLASRPNIDVQLKERASIDIVKAVQAGSADVGIVSDAVDGGVLTRFPFAVDRLVLVVPRDSEWASRRRVALADVAGLDFVGLGADSPLQNLVCDQAARIGRRIAFRVRMRTFETLCQLVQQRVGVAIIPQTAAHRCRRTMAIKAIPLSDEWAARRLLLCIRDFDDLSPHARELVNHLRTIS